LIADRRRLGKSQVDISFPEIEKFDHLPPARVEGASAFVSIMEGCSKFCSFCIVPYTRGEEVSRPFDDVLTEVAGLAAQGVQEVTLLGQNVNAYRGAMAGSGQALAGEEAADLALLIEYIAEIPGIERIRYTTSHPREVSQRLIDVYARVPKLVSHLHLPVQSGSDRVLAAMKRGYTALEYKSLVRKLRAARPDLSLSSDFIVGFPGETDDDFEKTMKLIDDVGFDASFSFIYSARPGTPAAELTDDTPQAVKLERLLRLQKRIDELAQAVSRGHGRQRAAGAGRRRRKRTAANWPGAPTTTASSISPAMLPTHAARSLPRRAHHLRDAALAARRDREPTYRMLTHMTPNPCAKAGPPNCCCRRSTTNSSANLCGALDENLRQIETALDVSIARRGERFTLRGEPRRRRAPPRRCSSSTPRPRKRCRSMRSSSA
jgi:hypothetical protein